jgi:hypothetical protein
MFKGLITVTCLGALSFFAWFGWSEYQRSIQQAQIEQADSNALRSQMRDNCARAIDAAEVDDMDTALRLSGNANALRRCRQILDRW